MKNIFILENVLETIIDTFNVYAQESRENPGIIDVTFIDVNYMNLCFSYHSTDKERFSIIYNIFANWLSENISLDEVFEKYENHFIDNNTLFAIKEDIKGRINAFQQLNGGNKLVDILKGCMNVKLYYYAKVPKKLKDKVDEHVELWIN